MTDYNGQIIESLESIAGTTSPDTLDWNGKVLYLLAYIATNGATGDVTGPSTNTDGYIPTWNGANSKTLADGIDPDTLAEISNFIEVDDSDTLSLSDIGNIIKCTNTGAATITVPPNSSVAIPTNSEVEVMAYSDQEVKIVAGTGVTIKGNIAETATSVTADDFCNINGQYTSLILKKVDTDEWVCVGSMKAAV